MNRVDVGRSVFTLEKFLSKDRCAELIARAEQRGFSIATINTRHGVEVDRDVRNNDRVIVDDLALAADLWGRLRDFVPAALGGRQARGVNERFRYYRYTPGQKFSWHSDGAFVRDNGETSLLTFMIYLNDEYEGGATEFSFAAVHGNLGMALLFEHQLSHQGAEVTRGRKYVLRSDVMYGPVGQWASR